MTREDVYALIPEHEFLEDAALKEKCADVWIDALEQTDWHRSGTLALCPIALKNLSHDCPENIISHTRIVTRLCKAMYEHMSDYFAKIGPCHREYLIAGAIVHDAGKLLEYSLDKTGEVGFSPTGRLFRHPCSGAYLAKVHGLPDEVVFMVLSHSNGLSPEGAKAPNIPESVILKHVDMMVFDYAKVFFPPLM